MRLVPQGLSNFIPHQGDLHLPRSHAGEHAVLTLNRKKNGLEPGDGTKMNRFDRRMGELAAYPGRGHAAVTENELQEFESTIGHTLPEDYREFLRDHNGCVVLNGVLLSETTTDGETVAYVF